MTIKMFMTLISTFEKTTKITPQEVIFRGVWPGLGEMYNIKVWNGYTTIIVKPGEDLEQRWKETKEKYACQA
jgi:hypothetical protein